MSSKNQAFRGNLFTAILLQVSRITNRFSVNHSFCNSLSEQILCGINYTDTDSSFAEKRKYVQQRKWLVYTTLVSFPYYIFLRWIH